MLIFLLVKKLVMEIERKFATKIVTQELLIKFLFQDPSNILITF